MSFGKCALYLFGVVLLATLDARHIDKGERLAVNLQAILAIHFREVGTPVAHNHSILCVARLGTCLCASLLVCQNAHCLYESALARIRLAEEGNHQLVPHRRAYRLLSLCAVFADEPLKCRGECITALLQ